MVNKETIIEEFELRVFSESYTRIYKCLSSLEEEEVWRSINTNIPSVGCLILHLNGNVRQWLLSGIGGAVDSRQRDEEFIAQAHIKKKDLVSMLEILKSELKSFFTQIESSNFEERYVIQGFDVTGFSAFIHVLEHFSYHTGQITTLTKLFKNVDLGYYDENNLNQCN